MGKVDGRVAVVTGGSSGIGFASAQEFVGEGAHVFLTGRREKELAAAVKEIGRNVTGIRADVSNSHDTHLYLAESNAQSRREWIAALDTIESFKPLAVIAGHKKPEKDDSPGIIEETRRYIRDFEGLAEVTTTAQELYDRMLEIYPNRANPGALWASAQAVKGKKHRFKSEK